jgi:hypothetical protein
MPPPARLERGPDPALPLTWFGAAHVALAAAGVALAANAPAALALPFHPPAALAVHLLTLGWITGTILGALYLVAPMAMRFQLPARRADRLAAAVYLGGVALLVVAFAASRYDLVPIAAAAIVAGAVLPVGRFLAGLSRAPVAPVVRSAIALAGLALLAAAIVGARLGARLGGSGVAVPHALLAAHLLLVLGGWSLLLPVGVGLRLVPMLIPTALPEGRLPAVAVGLWTLGLTVAVASALAGLSLRPGALILAAGYLTIVAVVVSMLRRPRPRAAGLPRPDWAMLLAAAAFVATAVGLGSFVALAFRPLEGARAAAAVAVVAALAFPTLLALGVGFRLMPLYAWLRAGRLWGVRDESTPPHPWASNPLQAVAALAGILAAVLAAAGFVRAQPGAIALAGAAIALAAAVSAAHHLTVFRRARRAFAGE